MVAGVTFSPDRIRKKKRERMTKKKKKTACENKRMVALQNPKQFSGRLSFISLFISARRDGSTQREGRGIWRKRCGNETDISSCYWGYKLVPLARSHSSHLLFFFCNVYCRVECNFLTLKISDWGTRRPFGDRRGAEVDANALRVG